MVNSGTIYCMGKRLIIQILLVAGLSNLVLFLGLFYNTYQEKRRYTKQLKTKQQEIDEKNILIKTLITETDKLNADKNGLLKENEWLIKEIHHRVKNNLQLVISLLNVQSEFLHSSTALNAIKESRERMEAIAIIHKKLYQTDNNTTEVNMRSYINELVVTIKDCFPERKKISFRVEVADIGLDISQSVPLGLILNEAITNAIKYAYEKNRTGSIFISFQNIEDERLKLQIADNGKGLPAGVDVSQPKTLGFQLINLFSEQLDGDLVYINKNGLTLVLTIKATDYRNGFSNKLTA